MKAMVLNKPAPIEEKPLQKVELPVPEPAENQILIKVSVCGACHTDIDEAEGRLIPTKMPIVPGHQVVGIVYDKGKFVTRFKIGQRAGITWLYWACGQCDFCKSGNENLCDSAKWTGKDADGGYAEYMTIGEQFAHSIPKRFTNSQAASLLCAGVIGYRAFRLARIRKNDVVGLFGFGASGHIVIQIIKYKFPGSRVFVFTRSGEHKQLAENLGADWTGSPGDKPPVKITKAIDFTPAGETLPNALGIMERGGRLVVNVIRKTSAVADLDYTRHLWLEKEIKSVANVTRKDAEEFLPLAGQIPIVPQVREFLLEEANDALLAIKQSKIRAAAVLKVG